MGLLHFTGRSLSVLAILGAGLGCSLISLDGYAPSPTSGSGGAPTSATTSSQADSSGSGGPGGAASPCGWFKSPVVLYQATSPKSIAADATSVYFLDDGDGSVGKVDKKTSAFTRLARTSDLTTPPDSSMVAERLALSSDAVYWTGNNHDICSDRVFKVKKTGEAAAKIWYDSCEARATSSIVVDGLGIFVASVGATGGILKFGGGTVTTLAQGSTPWMLVADANRVYASRTNDGVLFRVSKAGGEAETVAVNQGLVSAMAADDQFIYWTSDGGRVLKLDKEKLGEPVPLAEDEPGPSGLALDDACVYFSDAADPAGKIRVVAKAGGEVGTLAGDQHLPVSIAVDASGVYWANRASGEIMMMQRE